MDIGSGFPGAHSSWQRVHDVGIGAVRDAYGIQVEGQEQVCDGGKGVADELEGTSGVECW